MLIALRALWTLAFIFVVPGASSADSWAKPQVKEVFSASRDHFVRVIPGNSLGEVVGFAGAAKGVHATAEFYQRATEHQPLRQSS